MSSMARHGRDARVVLAPVPHLRRRLPGPQSAALGAAFGLADEARVTDSCSTTARCGAAGSD